MCIQASQPSGNPSAEELSSILQEAPGNLLNSMLKMTRVIDNRLKLNALMLKCLNLPGKCNYAKILLCY